MAIISIPKNSRFRKNPYAIILNVRSFWWTFGYMRRVRAMTIGHVVLLGPHVEVFDVEHELIHVEQYQRMPILHPFLYYIQLIRYGYRENKYEKEAYSRAGNFYKKI